MGKFGFGKKDDGDDSSNRTALFGKKNKNTNPPANNPYANLPTQADAYNAAKARAGVPGYTQKAPSPQPPMQSGYGPSAGGGGYPDDKKQGPGGYGAPNPGSGSGSGSGYPADQKTPAYTANKYGAQSGYGADRYGGGSGGGGSRYGAGGYGGLGGTPSSNATDGDENRDALFGGAKTRMDQRQNQQPPPYEAGSAQAGDYRPPEPQYEAYGDRQLTAEEEEEEDVTATKEQIRFIKQQDVSSTRNALRIAAQAEETGMNTLARIGAQGERIHNTEKNLDLTSNHNRSAEDKARELKKLNRSMFAVHVSNPFTATSRAEKMDMAVLERHQLEREQREATRRAGYETDQRMQKTFKEMGGKGTMSAQQKKEASLAERAKYQFEADSEDDEMENEIDSNLDALGGAAARLNGLARATGKEVEEQNRHLERINQKSTKVDDEIAMNRARIDRIR